MFSTPKNVQKKIFITKNQYQICKLNDVRHQKIKEKMEENDHIKNVRTRHNDGWNVYDFKIYTRFRPIYTMNYKSTRSFSILSSFSSSFFFSSSFLSLPLSLYVSTVESSLYMMCMCAIVASFFFCWVFEMKFMHIIRYISWINHLWLKFICVINVSILTPVNLHVIDIF